MSRAVIVLGFHRSGTSMTTRLLSMLGVDLGPEEEMLPAGPGNVHGYWELEWMNELNDEILEALGASALDPPGNGVDWRWSPRLDELRVEARERLDRSFGSAPLWGFKDPRTCLTLPFWRELLAERGARVSFVVCVRSPAESVRSMKVHDFYPEMPAAEFGGLWLQHTGRALLDTAGAERATVFYDDLLADPVGELARLAAAFDLPAAEPDALRDGVDRGLRHHVRSALDTAAEDELPLAVRMAYLALRAAQDARRAGSGTPELAEALELVAVEQALVAWAEHCAVRERLAVGMWQGP